MAAKWEPKKASELSGVELDWFKKRYEMYNTPQPNRTPSMPRSFESFVNWMQTGEIMEFPNTRICCPRFDPLDPIHTASEAAIKRLIGK